MGGGQVPDVELNVCGSVDCVSCAEKVGSVLLEDRRIEEYVIKNRVAREGRLLRGISVGCSLRQVSTLTSLKDILLFV